MFKNLKIGTKIAVGFGSVLLLTIVVGAAGYIGLHKSSDGFAGYREMARDANLVGQLQASMLMVRIIVKDFVSTASEKDRQEYHDYIKQMHSFLANARKEIKIPSRAAKIEFVAEEVKKYEAGFDELVGSQTRRDQLVKKTLDVIGPEMERKLFAIMESAHKDDNAETAFYTGQTLRDLLLARLYVVKFLDDNSSASESRAHREFTAFQAQLEKLDQLLKNSRRRALLAEVHKRSGEYLEAFNGVVQAITERNQTVTGVLDKIGPRVAGAVDDVKLDIKTTQDQLGPALVASNRQASLIMVIVGLAALIGGGIMALMIIRGIAVPLKRINAGLAGGSDQVASASSQIASASQQLAEGSSEQAASLEETTSSMEELASQTRANAENAQQADGLMNRAKETMGLAGQAMVDMAEAMRQINESGTEISKIVRSIDEIAFQTNLLALNAAVEAARAGEAGQGFAVVADEVRNLAMRAAEAAKNTQALVEDTVNRIDQGAILVEKTKSGFAGVTDNVDQVGVLVAEIASASVEQSQGIDQINRAMVEMDQVVQATAANAEESASSAEELSFQATAMQNMVLELNSMIGTGSRNGAAPDRAGLSGSSQSAGRSLIEITEFDED